MSGRCARVRSGRGLGQLRNTKGDEQRSRGGSGQAQAPRNTVVHSGSPVTEQEQSFSDSPKAPLFAFNVKT